ncbi:MAG: 2Fe-2S iron-sulfur cluster binding domain-containing protein, partial [Clostridia bacterium]|nr:2Fe-2S iron-sulfur cluster binding domain-containing protein [Clostridia bacterium]
MNGKINGREVACEKGQTLLEILGNSGFTLDAPCGGRGVCGKCKVYVKGNVSPLSAKERALLTESEIKSGVRLACYCRAEGEFELTTEKSSYKIQTDTNHTDYEICPDEKTAEFAKNNGKAVGAAVDIGTTTVVAVFYDL